MQHITIKVLVTWIEIAVLFTIMILLNDGHTNVYYEELMIAPFYNYWKILISSLLSDLIKYIFPTKFLFHAILMTNIQLLYYSKMMLLALDQVYNWGFKCNAHNNYNYIIKAKWSYFNQKLFTTEEEAPNKLVLGLW